MAPWFLQRLLRDRQALSGTPAGQGQYAGRVDSLKGIEYCCTPLRCMCLRTVPVLLHVLIHLLQITFSTELQIIVDNFQDHVKVRKFLNVTVDLQI